MRSILAILLLASAPMFAAAPPHRYTHYHVRATAFCLHGLTAAGTVSHIGTAAADPAFLPIGTTVRVEGVGEYSGEYLITDTGSKVAGRHIDLRLPSRAAARKFGSRMVWIQVVKWGNGDVKPEEDHVAKLRAPVH